MDDATTTVTADWMEQAPEFARRPVDYGNLPVIMPEDRQPSRTKSYIVAAVLAVVAIAAIALIAIAR